MDGGKLHSFGGEWSKRKLQCVEGYLRAFLKVMKEQDWADLWYIDAFSGEGVQYLKHVQLGEDEESANKFIAGSSMRALAISAESEQDGGRGFAHFVFIELDAGKLDALRSRITIDYPGCLDRCRFIQGDANAALPDLIRSIDWERSRGVAFIDPFATEFAWSSLAAFLDTRCDIWLLFPLYAIMRMLPVDHVPSEEWGRTLTRVFGDDGWRSLYAESRQLNLFGDAEYVRSRGTNELLEYSKKRFEAAFPGVWGPAVLRSPQRSPLFALFALVSNNSPRALAASQRIANALLRGIEAQEMDG